MTAKRAGPIRVLLVDDHCLMLWGLERLIQAERSAMVVVGSTTNCGDGLALAGRVNPDVILLDLDLGEENGLEAIPRFVERSPAKLLVFTRRHDKSVHAQAVQAGARGVVEKAASADTVLTAIQKVNGGELWLDRGTMCRLFDESARRNGVFPVDPDQQRIAVLTDRERRVIAAISSHPGETACAVAKMLHVSEHTLRNHLTSIYRKLGVTNRMELFVCAQKWGLDKLTVDVRAARNDRAGTRRK